MPEFENKKEPILSRPAFIARLLKYLFYSCLVFATSIIGGTLGYRYFGELAWIDAFHNACMILTGMGPVAEMKSTTAKLFSSFYALYSGIAFLSTVAIMFAPIAHRLLHILHMDDKD
jgi:hypothetical protein